MKNYDERLNPYRLEGLQEEGGEDKKFLVFHIGGGSFGVEVPYVMEILWGTPISPIPGVPEYFDGVCNWKGTIIPVVTLGKKQDKPAQEAFGESIIIVIRAAGYECGFSITETPKIVNFTDKEKLEGEIPSVMEGIVNVRGAYNGENGLVYVIDEEELLKSLVVYE